MLKKILLLGSGELGKEFTISCQRLGQQVIAVDSYLNAPAMQVADQFEVINMLNGQELDSLIEKYQPDIIVPEIEAIRTERLYNYEAAGIQVVPSAKAANFAMNRKAIRDLAARELKIKTPNYLYASSLDELIISVNKIGVPCVIKPLMSSSGKGQSIIRTKTDIETAWKAAEKGRGDSSKVIVEEFVDFESEITLLTVTQKNGKTLFCQPIGHLQERGDYQESWQPALVTAEQLADAQNIAKKVTDALGGEGIWGVEFFLTKDAVYFSELSPRPHDTGMVTLANTQNFNQFELHARAVLGLDIPTIDFQKSGASVAILTESIGTTPKYCGLEEAAKIANSDFRIFGKHITRPYRRMGVALAYGPLDADMKEIRKTAKEVASKIKVK